MKAPSGPGVLIIIANPKALKALPEIRKLIFEGNYEKAQDMANKDIISQGAQGMPYQTVGSLYLHFPGSEKYADYYRDLNIENAVASVKYKVRRRKLQASDLLIFPRPGNYIKAHSGQAGKNKFYRFDEQSGESGCICQRE